MGYKNLVLHYLLNLNWASFELNNHKNNQDLHYLIVQNLYNYLANQPYLILSI